MPFFMNFHYHPYSKITRVPACAATMFLCFFCTANAQNLIAYNNSTAPSQSERKSATTPGTVGPTADSAWTFDVECRDPRPDESATINKARQVIDKCIGGALQQIGWQTRNSDQVNVSIATHPNPSRPMFICSRAFDLTISPDPNSAYGKTMNDSIRFYQSQSSRAAILRMVILTGMQNIKIRIDENSPYLKSRYDHDETDKYTVLHVPGAGYAYRLTEPEQGAEADVPPDYKTYVLIGNWTGADMNANTYVNYPFIHKTGGAYIETLTLQIAGPASIADKIIHNVDWQGLSAALAK
jgi:hypothetical protein